MTQQFMKQKLFLGSIIIYMVLFGCCDLFSQRNKTATHRFENTLDYFGLYYYEPTEAWLHPVPQKSKDYGPFDLILQSSDEPIEIRYRFKKLDSRQNLAHHPQLDLYQYVATLASNEQSRNIILTEIDKEIIDTIFNADWGLYADFTPKESLAFYPYCRLIALYKEDHALVYSMIFYEEEIPEYFELPISFQEESDYQN